MRVCAVGPSVCRDAGGSFYYQEMGDLQLYFISTKDNVADVFTKPLEKITFSKHRDVLVTA